MDDVICELNKDEIIDDRLKVVNCLHPCLTFTLETSIFRYVDNQQRKIML